MNNGGEKKGVIFTPWQLVAHTVNLKSEDHTRGHFLKSSHTCWKIKKKAGLFGTISLFSTDLPRWIFTMKFKDGLENVKGAQRQNALGSARLGAARWKFQKLIRKHSGDSFKINSVINSLFFGSVHKLRAALAIPRLHIYLWGRRRRWWQIFVPSLLSRQMWVNWQ